MGKKYIVEIGRLERLYKAYVNGNGKPNITWLSPEVDLTPYTEPDLEQIRKEAYAEGFKDGQYAERNGLIASYAQKQEEIKVGDEVDWMGDKYVVTYVRYEAKKADMISCKFGSACENVAFSALGKTGRHFPEIATILEKMRGEQDG